MFFCVRTSFSPSQTWQTDRVGNDWGFFAWSQNVRSPTLLGHTSSHTFPLRRRRRAAPPPSITRITRARTATAHGFSSGCKWLVSRWPYIFPFPFPTRSVFCFLLLRECLLLFLSFLCSPSVSTLPSQLRTFVCSLCVYFGCFIGSSPLSLSPRLVGCILEGSFCLFLRFHLSKNNYFDSVLCAW